MEKSTLQRLNDLSDKLQTLYEPIDIANYVAPLNKQTEKQTFLSAYHTNQSYNPQFTYKPTPPNWEKHLRTFLTELNPNYNPWEEWIYKDILWTLDLMKTAETHDPEFTTDVTLKVFKKPSVELIKATYSVLKNLPQESTENLTISAKETAQTLQTALTKIGLTQWQVIVNDTMSARMSVRAIDKQIKINANYSFSKQALKRLLVHEIGTHVFRAVNGENQPLKILRFGLYNYLFAEEGLANYHESLYNLQTPTDKRRYAIRVIAAYLSLEHDFYHVFCELVKYTSLDEAFDICTRAKRGFIDTSVKGSHVKDQVYFAGFQQVSNYLKQHPEDYPLLMSGKVSLDMLPLLKGLQKQNLWVKPKYLPESLISDM